MEKICFFSSFKIGNESTGWGWGEGVKESHAYATPARIVFRSHVHTPHARPTTQHLRVYLEAPKVKECIKSTKGDGDIEETKTGKQEEEQHTVASHYTYTRTHAHTKKTARRKYKNAREIRRRDGNERDNEKEEGIDSIAEQPYQLQRKTEHTDKHTHTGL